jgi:sterol desaturase/sphingolipid hydroxylase (fatty acid hydroxylase superfamily)
LSLLKRRPYNDNTYCQYWCAMEFYLIQDWLLVNGEDAQVTVFFSFLGLFILIERILAFRSPAQDKRKRWMTNLGLSVTTIAVLPITPVSLITAGAWAQQNDIGLMNQVSLPIFLAVVVQLLLRGFISFFVHWLNHKVPLLWRLHRVHHMDREIDVSSTLRGHPLEFPIGALIGVPLALLFGLSPWLLLFYELLDAAIVVFSHSNVALPKTINRWLSYIIVTPNLHRIHHSCTRYETDSNFSAVFPVWDVIFGTFRQTSETPQKSMALGLSEVRDGRSDDFLWLLASPVKTFAQAQTRPIQD